MSTIFIILMQYHKNLDCFSRLAVSWLPLNIATPQVESQEGVFEQHKTVKVDITPAVDPSKAGNNHLCHVSVTCQIHFSHVSVTCQIHFSHVSVTCQIHFSHVSVTCQIHFSHVSVTCQIHCSHVSVTCQIHFSHVSVICQIHFSHVSVTCQIHFSHVSDSFQSCICSFHPHVRFISVMCQSCVILISV